MRSQRWIAIGFWGLLAVSCSSMVSVIPPDAKTVTRMAVTHGRIHRYLKEHRVVPADLSVLPERGGFDNRTTDGWGRPLIYSADDQGIISLTSLGRDGQVGGDDDDEDIVRQYRTRNEDGTLNIDDEFWIIDSLVFPDAE